MKTRFRHLKERLRTSLWFVPSVLVLFAIILSQVTLQLDARLGTSLRDVPFLFSSGPEGATAVLAAIAGSMIGVTGVIFSITIVALTLASSQLGPRLLRAFIRDRANQVVLGVFIGTFTFSLLALRSIDRSAELVPEITVNVAMLLALLCLAMLIYFIHHIASGIQADAVIAQVARDLHETVADLYPEDMGHEPGDHEEVTSPEISGTPARIRASRTGYIEAIEAEALFERVVRGGLVVRLDVRPGDFVATGGVLARVWSANGEPTPDLKSLEGLILIGDQPSAEQDIEFLLAQLVEIAVRALSPGINDPFTAQRCIDRLSAALCDLGGRRFPSPLRVDDEGRVRVIARAPTWTSMVDITFDQVRQHARSSVAVTIRLVEGITRVAVSIPTDGRRIDALTKHVDQIERSARKADIDKDDLADIERRIRTYRETVGLPRASQP